jgi:hypothetical protein
MFVTSYFAENVMNLLKHMLVNFSASKNPNELPNWPNAQSGHPAPQSLVYI